MNPPELCSQVQEAGLRLQDDPLRSGLDDPLEEILDREQRHHLAQCTDCREVLQAHDDLLGFARSGDLARSIDPDQAAVGKETPATISTDDLADVRAGVMKRLGGSSPSGTTLESSTTAQPGTDEAPSARFPAGRTSATSASSHRSSVLAPLALAAAMLLTLGLAVALGWVLGERSLQPEVAALDVPRPLALDERVAVDAGLMVSAVDRVAQESWPLETVRPYEISNVRVARSAAGQVDLAFDLTAHLEVQRSENDPLVTEVLLQALAEPSELAERLQAVEEIPAAADARVQQALRHTALEDDSEVVRQFALERLIAAANGGASASDRAATGTLEATLLEILRSEPSVPMRLMALDALTAQQQLDAGERQILRRALEESPEDGVQPILVRAAERFGSELD